MQSRRLEAESTSLAQVHDAPSGFDKLARAYRWMEYVSFGPLLWWTRTAWLGNMQQARTALVLGDGDGRFTAELLRRNRCVEVTAVDASRAMLAATAKRADALGSNGRLRTVHADALRFAPTAPLDLICTHFFLDCLQDSDARHLVARCAAALQPGGLWVVSEFAVPRGPLRVPADVLVRMLYAAFRVLTGLSVRALPDYPAALRAAGLAQVAVQTRLGGILRAELWARPHGDAPDAKGASMQV